MPCFITLTGLASLLMDRRADREAEPLLREALDILQQKLPETRWQVVSVQSLLAVCLTHLPRISLRRLAE